MRKLSIILVFLLICSSARATTYYVRTDGSTPTNCTGTTDAAYPGSGTGQDCGWNHPNWALPMNGQPTTNKISGGDTVVIHGPEAGTGQYRMGCSGSANCQDSTINITETSTCYNDWTYDCGDVTVPSGSEGAETKVIGCTTSGCSGGTKPQLWGSGRQERMFNLTNTDYVIFDDIEITDHDAKTFNSVQQTQLICGAGINSLCSRVGIYADGGWSNLTFKNMWIHGLAKEAFNMAGDTDYGTDHNLLIQDTIIDKNGFGGFNGDTCNDSTCPFHGTLTLDNVTITYNGCVESYPLSGSTTSTEDDIEDVSCIDQNDGGYGDGFGTARTSGNWYVTNCDISHNVSDGLDLLYGSDATALANVYVDKSIFEGNDGNQFKFRGGDLILTNSMLIGNCGYFSGKDFTDDASAPNNFIPCRAGGATIAIEGDGVSGAEWGIYNNTIYAQSYGIYVSDNYENYCDGNESLFVYNNLFVSDNTGDIGDTNYYDSVCSITFNNDYNLVGSYFSGTPCPSGNNICSDPKITTQPTYGNFGLEPDFYLLSDSPARDAADETVDVSDSNDYNNFYRGGSWDIGALEYGSTPSGEPTPTPTPSPTPTPTPGVADTSTEFRGISFFGMR